MAPVRGAADARRAARRYADLVAAARDTRLWDEALRQQMYLGDEGFVERMQALAEPQRTSSREVPMAQRRKPATLEHWLETCASRDEALLHAHVQSGISMTELARSLGLSVSRVSRLIAAAERREGANGKT